MVHHRKMYLTFKVNYDIDIIQIRRMVKNEKNDRFNFTYHEHFSLSSTFCGEEPRFFVENFLKLPFIYIFLFTNLSQFMRKFFDKFLKIT